MVTYLEYLTKIRRRLAEEGTASAGLLDAMRMAEVNDTIGILTNEFRFSNISTNMDMIAQLKRSGYYPIHGNIGKYDWLR